MGCEGVEADRYLGSLGLNILCQGNLCYILTSNKYEFFLFVVYVEILDAWGTLVMKLVCCFTFLSFILRVPYIGKQCYLMIGAQAL